jgi:hypothetical protein
MSANGNGTNGNGKLATELATVVPKHGRGRLLTGGKVGHKGAGGRHPDEFKAALAQLASETVRRGYVTKILNNHNHPQFMSALKWATDRGYGPVTQTHEISGKDGAPIAFTFKIASPNESDDSDSA